MSLKIAKFINKHLKVYIQEQNYAMAISKVPQCPSSIETSDKILPTITFAAAQCDVLLTSRKNGKQ